MIPSIDDRLASMIRALTEVILPHLPPEASLAQEQAQLCIGHLHILRAQIDAAPAFEREELADAVALARALCAALPASASAAVAAAVDAADGHEPRSQRQAIHEAIEMLIGAVSRHADPAVRQAMNAIILDHEYTRSQKDRAWCAPFGFDTL